MAILGSYLKVGLWTISSTWIGVLVGLSMTFWLIKRETNRAGFDGSKLSDTLFDSVLYGIISAFLTPLLLMPKETFERPFQILLGGFVPYASWIGLAVGGVAFVFKFRKSPVPLFLLIDVILPAVLFGWSIYSVLVADYGTRTTLAWGASLSDGMYHPVNIYRALLFAVGGWIIIRKVPLQQSGIRGALGLILLGTSGLLVSLVEYNPTIWVFLSPLQWGYMVSAIAGSILFIKRNSLMPLPSDKADHPEVKS